MRVVKSHAAENGEGFQEVLIIFGEGEVVKFIDELHHAKNFARGVPDGLAQNRPVFKTRPLVHLRVEPLVIVCIGNVDCLKKRTRVSTFFMH